MDLKKELKGLYLSDIVDKILNNYPIVFEVEKFSKVQRLNEIVVEFSFSVKGVKVRGRFLELEVQILNFEVWLNDNDQKELTEQDYVLLEKTIINKLKE